MSETQKLTDTINQLLDELEHGTRMFSPEQPAHTLTIALPAPYAYWHDVELCVPATRHVQEGCIEVAGERPLYITPDGNVARLGRIEARNVWLLRRFMLCLVYIARENIPVELDTTELHALHETLVQHTVVPTPAS